MADAAVINNYLYTGPVGATGTIESMAKIENFANYAKGGILNIKEKVEYIKIELQVIKAVKEARDEFKKAFLNSLKETPLKELANDKDFNKKLDEFMKVSNKELWQSSEIGELMANAGSVTGKFILGLVSSIAATLTGGVLGLFIGPSISAAGEIGQNIIDSNAASTDTFKFSEEEITDQEIAMKIAFIQGVVSKLKGLVEDIAKKIQRGEYSIDNVKAIVVAEIKKLATKVDEEVKETFKNKTEAEQQDKGKGAEA